MSARPESLPGRSRLRAALVPLGLVAAAALLVLGSHLLEQERLRMEARLQEDMAELAWMQEAARQLDAAPRMQHARTGTPGGSSVLALVEARARTASIPVMRLQPDGGHGVHLELGATPFGSLVTWLARLQTRDGLRPASLHLRRTEVQGRVAGDVRLVTGPGPRGGL